MQGGLTLCICYFDQPLMLARQIQEWERFPAELQIIVVDDGSPTKPALPVVAEASAALQSRLRLYRIQVNRDWGREGARNLAAAKTSTDWLIQTDIDHILSAAAAAHLVEFDPNPNFWYRFSRFRNGKADETRRKDAIADDVEYGEVKSHIDSYLITAAMYSQILYDEDFIGCLGGGTDFLRRLEWHFGAPLMLPPDIRLDVYTRHIIADASVTSLSRDTRRGKQIARSKSASRPKPAKSLRFSWQRQL